MLSIIKDRLKNLYTALTFLTIFPNSTKKTVSGEELGAATAFFPLVGLCIGSVLVIEYFLLSHFFTNSLTSLFLIGSLTIFSRGLHIDGFADVIDGFVGGYTKEKTIEIMKDSAIGVFGSCGIFFLFLTKFIALNNLSSPMKISILFIMPLVGRLAIVFISYISNYIEGMEGLGKSFTDNVKEGEFWTATLTSLSFSLIIMRGHGILIILAILTFCILFSRYSKKRMGGVTGDIMGAACEISEVIALLLASIFDTTISTQLFDGTWI